MSQNCPNPNWGKPAVSDLQIFDPRSDGSPTILSMNRFFLSLMSKDERDRWLLANRKSIVSEIGERFHISVIDINNGVKQKCELSIIKKNRIFILCFAYIDREVTMILPNVMVRRNTHCGFALGILVIF